MVIREEVHASQPPSAYERVMASGPKVNTHELAAVTSLVGPELYKHFVTRVADWEEAWGLYAEGWALMANDAGARVFPLWPAAEYARLCAVDEWESYEPKAIPLDELVGELLPGLAEDEILPGVFPTPKDKAPTPPAEQLIVGLSDELESFE